MIDLCVFWWWWFLTEIKNVCTQGSFKKGSQGHRVWSACSKKSAKWQRIVVVWFVYGCSVCNAFCCKWFVRSREQLASQEAASSWRHPKPAPHSWSEIATADLSCALVLPWPFLEHQLQFSADWTFRSPNKNWVETWKPSSCLWGNSADLLLLHLPIHLRS